MFKRTLIIGDVHGCLDETGSLLDLLDYRQSHDRLIFVGDLINRGPNSMGVLELIAKLNADFVLGNHELGFLKFLDTSVKAGSAFAALKKSMGNRIHYWKTWLEDYLLFIKSEGADPKDSFLVVHAPGLSPVLNQKIRRLTYWPASVLGISKRDNLEGSVILHGLSPTMEPGPNCSVIGQSR